LKADKKKGGDSEDEKRPFKKANISESGPLSFLPAPKRTDAEIFEESTTKIKPTNLQNEIIVERKPRSEPKKEITKEDEEIALLKKLENEHKVQQQKQKSQSNQKAFRDLLQSATITVPIIPTKKSSESVPQQELPDQHEVAATSQHYGYFSPTTPFIPQLQYPGPPLPPLPPGMDPRQFRDLYNGKANIVDLSISDIRQNWPKYSEPLMEPMPAMNEDKIDVIPSRDARKQHQITYLMWDAKQKAQELEAKRAIGFKNRKDTKSKYGW